MVLFLIGHRFSKKCIVVDKVVINRNICFGFLAKFVFIFQCSADALLGGGYYLSAGVGQAAPMAIARAQHPRRCLTC